MTKKPIRELPPVKSQVVSLPGRVFTGRIEKPAAEEDIIAEQYNSPLHQMAFTAPICLWKDSAAIGEVCTIIVGRTDDWLKVVVAKEDIITDPGYLEWTGVAVFKKTYQISQTNRYRLRFLSAAFRNRMHWSELIGGDAVISPPYKWQLRFTASDFYGDPEDR